MQPASTTYVFESALRTSRTALWQWIIDFRCLRREMMPWLRMTSPRGVRHITDLPYRAGQPLCVSVLCLFGVLPLAMSRLTFMDMQERQGFLEQSPITWMRAWSHQRQILDCPDQPDLVLLRDTVTFVPRFFPRLSTWLVRRFFAHRHARLRRVHRASA